MGDAYQGWWGRLNSQPLSQHQDEIRRGFYGSAQTLAEWIKTTLSIQYHPQGLIKLLHRLGFVYNKTTLVAPKADPVNKPSLSLNLSNR